MSKNNESRTRFAELCEKYKLEKIGNRNCFKKGNEIIAFSMCTGDKLECRQFYDDCTMLLCYHYDSQSLYLINRSNLNISKSANRIAPDGLICRTATCEIEGQFRVVE